MPEDISLPFGVEKIKQLIPHRYPFLFVDRVTDYRPGNGITGVKNITANEPFFQGHFPHRAVMPGVVMIEALAQLGAIYAKLETMGRNENMLIVLAGTEVIRFRKIVVPGDILTLNMSNVKRKLGTWTMEGSISNGNEVVMEGVLRAAEMRDSQV